MPACLVPGFRITAWTRVDSLLTSEGVCTEGLIKSGEPRRVFLVGEECDVGICSTASKPGGPLEVYTKTVRCVLRKRTSTQPGSIQITKLSFGTRKCKSLTLASLAAFFNTLSIVYSSVKMDLYPCPCHGFSLYQCPAYFLSSRFTSTFSNWCTWSGATFVVSKFAMNHFTAASTSRFMNWITGWVWGKINNRRCTFLSLLAWWGAEIECFCVVVCFEFMWNELTSANWLTVKLPSALPRNFRGWYWFGNRKRRSTQYPTEMTTPKPRTNHYCSFNRWHSAVRRGIRQFFLIPGISRKFEIPVLSSLPKLPHNGPCNNVSAKATVVAEKHPMATIESLFVFCVAQKIQ